MKKHVPTAKLSKKKKRALAKETRVTWSDFRPVTRTIKSKKTYNRKKIRRGDNFDSSDFLSVYSLYCVD